MLGSGDLVPGVLLAAPLGAIHIALASKGIPLPSLHPQLPEPVQFPLIHRFRQGPTPLWCPSPRLS